MSLASLLPFGGAPEEVRRGWEAGGADPPPRTRLAVAADGPIEVDLVRDGPHVLVAGTTGAGKSELLRSLVAGLAVGTPPDHLAFVLVDYKGGAAFDACARLPHVAGVVTDLDERLAERALRSLHAELRRREQLLRAAGAADLTAYRARAGSAPIPRLVVVVDELATLAHDLPEFVPSLVGVAQRGRSLGVHLVLATQRPAGAISDDIRANTNLRIALRVQDVADAVDVVGVPDAASLPRQRPGRAVLRFGPGECVVAQVASARSVSAKTDRRWSSRPSMRPCRRLRTPCTRPGRPRSRCSSRRSPRPRPRPAAPPVTAIGPGCRHCPPTCAGRTCPRARPACWTTRTTRPSDRGGGIARPVTCCASAPPGVAAVPR